MNKSTGFCFIYLFLYYILLSIIFLHFYFFVLVNFIIELIYINYLCSLLILCPITSIILFSLIHFYSFLFIFSFLLLLLLLLNQCWCRFTPPSFFWVGHFLGGLINFWNLSWMGFELGTSRLQGWHSTTIPQRHTFIRLLLYSYNTSAAI